MFSLFIIPMEKTGKRNMIGYTLPNKNSYFIALISEANGHHLKRVSLFGQYF